MTIAFLFPGQGSQVVGMGADLYESSPAARAVFDLADATLGFPISLLCFEGPEETLTATENAQPAILTASLALLAALSEGGSPADFTVGRAAFVAGHSLGEYSALVAAGALDAATALRLVRRRGELMAAAHEGTMSAVIGMGEADLEAICEEVAIHGPAVIANYNAPGQLVISGAARAVEQAGALARERGAKRVIPLKVSAAFHSPLMEQAAEQLAELARDVAVDEARVPVISNVTARPMTRASAIRGELVAQITAPVRWIASVQRMAEQGATTFVEIGPGKVLTALVKRILPEPQMVNIATLEDARAFLEGGA